MNEITQSCENTIDDLSAWYETPNSEEAVKHMDATNVVAFATGLWS